MSTGEIQYITDSELIEKIYSLSTLDYVLYKEAGIVEDLFSGVGSAVSSFVQSHVDTSSTGSFLKSVLNLLAPGMFFKMNPILGVLYTAGSMFGFDAGSLLSSIVNIIKPKIIAGEKITPEEVNQAGMAAGGGMPVEADFFSDLRMIEKNGALIKSAQAYSQPLGGSFLGMKGAPLLLRLFGFIGQKRKGAGKSLAVGFIVWFIKTLLLSAGLLAVGGVTKSMIIGDDKPKEDIAKDHFLTPQSQESDKTLKQPGVLTKYVPIRVSPQDSLLEWAKGFYPEVSGYEDIIKNNKLFNKAVQTLSKGYEKERSLAPLPAGISEKDLVNSFINDVKSEIEKLKSLEG